MEKLTEKQYKSLVEAYSAVYNEDHQSELNEEQQINEFLEVVNSLVEEGYDLSEYSYDELYELHLNEGIVNVLFKAGMKRLGKGLRTSLNIPQNKNIARELGGRAIQGTANLVGKGLQSGGEVIKTAVSPIGHVFQGTLGNKSPLRNPIPAAIAGGAAALYALNKGGMPNISMPQMPQMPSAASSKPVEPKPEEKKSQSLKIKDGQVVGYENFDIFNTIKVHLLDEGYADTEEAALAIMSNMSEEWRGDILDEAAKDQSDKQIEKGVKTTYKAQGVLANTHQGRSPGLSRLPRGEREAKSTRMRGRLNTRRDDLFKERGNREDAARAELKKKYGL